MPELQAARGASLITAESSTPGSPAPPAGPDGRAGGRRATLLVLVVAIAAYVVDQVSKHLAVSRLTGHDPVKVVGSMLELTLLRNPGAAFSTGTSLTPLITLVAMIATVVVVWFALRVRHRGWAVALGLLLAGILGNLTDRLVRSPGPFRGHVVDFFAFPHWPVFNVADICIDAAGVLIVVLLLRGDRFDGSPRSSAPASTGSGSS